MISLLVVSFKKRVIKWDKRVFRKKGIKRAGVGGELLSAGGYRMDTD